MSREKFEAIYGPMGFDLTRMQCLAPEPWSEYADEKTGYAWAGWLAGRESMRDEAAEICLAEGDMWYSGQAAAACDKCRAIIKEIQP